jgi:DNA-binding NarL/FixJ family response regulator
MGTRVLVVDDRPIVRCGVHALLDGQDGLAIVGEAGNPETAMCLVGELGPDVVMQDLWISGEMAGACLCKELKGLPRAPRVLIYTAHNSHRDVYSCYLAGADGFVHKCEEPRRLVDTIRQVASGKRVWLLGEEPGSETPSTYNAPSGAHLTAKEQEILVLMLEGHSNRRIAEALCVSLATIKTHVGSVYKKLGVSSREELFAARSKPSSR